jgi:hypothetical protein
MPFSDITAICSLIIALAAVTVTVWQGAITRRHSRLSVRPLLAVKSDRFFDDVGATVMISIHNCGLGPAIIRDRFFRIDGKRSDLRTPDVIQRMIDVGCFGACKPVLRVHGLPGISSAILPGAIHVIAKLELPGMSQAALEALDVADESTSIELVVDADRKLTQRGCGQ